MDNLDLTVLRLARQWLDAGHRVTLGTLTRTWGSAPRPPGSLVALRGDGQVAGSVSGGCIEEDLIARAREGSLGAERPEVVRYGVDAESARRFGLPCGGTLELVLERLHEGSGLTDLLDALAGGRRVQRRLDLATGQVTLHDGEVHGGDDAPRLDAQALVSRHGPRWRLVLIGAGQLSRCVAEMAGALDYDITVCDPREEYADGFAVPGVKHSREMPDDLLRGFAVDRHTAVIALTHDPKIDDLALLEALPGPAFYVGALGSQASQRARQRRLSEHFGLTEAQLARLHGPVGLKNGARTPAEIAISILAELVAVRRGYHIPPPVRVASLVDRPDAAA